MNMDPLYAGLRFDLIALHHFSMLKDYAEAKMAILVTGSTLRGAAFGELA